MTAARQITLWFALLVFGACDGLLDAGDRFRGSQDDGAAGGFGDDARVFALAPDAGAGALAPDLSPVDAGPDTTCSLTGAQYEESLTADFPARDKLPQSNIPQEDWDSFPSGPPAAAYPKVEPPACVDEITWKRDRVIAVAERYLGLPYEHDRFPALGGLDCSTFTSWVYNYGLGIKFDSGAATQGDTVGRQLRKKEAFAKGDLLFFWNSSSGPSTAGHAALFIEGDEFIHSNPTPQDGVQYEKLTGWWKDHFLWARRVIE